MSEDKKSNSIDYEKTKVSLPLLVIVLIGVWFVSQTVSSGKLESKLEMALEVGEIKTDVAVVRQQVDDIQKNQEDMKEQLKELNKNIITREQ